MAGGLELGSDAFKTRIETMTAHAVRLGRCAPAARAVPADAAPLANPTAGSEFATEGTGATPLLRL